MAAGGVIPKTGWRTVEPVYASDASCFLDCLEQNKESDVPVSMGAHVVEVILAGYRAAATGETVSIPE